MSRSSCRQPSQCEDQPSCAKHKKTAHANDIQENLETALTMRLAAVTCKTQLELRTQATSRNKMQSQGLEKLRKYCACHTKRKSTHFTLHTLHSTLNTLHCTLLTPHFTLLTPHSTLYTPHFTLHTPDSTLYTLHFTLYTAHSTPNTLHTLHCPLHTLHSTLLTLHSALWYPCVSAPVPFTYVCGV